MDFSQLKKQWETRGIVTTAGSPANDQTGTTTTTTANNPILSSSSSPATNNHHHPTPITTTTTTTTNDTKSKSYWFTRLVKSETEFVDKLCILRDVYIRPLRDDAKLAKPLILSQKTEHQKLSVFFTNVETITALNERFLTDLLESGEIGVGTVLNQYSSLFRMYKEYLSDYAPALVVLEKECTLPDSKLSKFLKDKESSPQAKNRNLWELVRQPLERLPIYQQHLVMLIATDPDDVDLRKATSEFDLTASLVLDDISRNKSSERLKLIQHDWTGANLGPRILLFDGPLEKVSRKGPSRCYFLLFKDVLVYGEYVSHDPFIGVVAAIAGSVSSSIVGSSSSSNNISTTGTTTTTATSVLGGKVHHKRMLDLSTMVIEDVATVTGKRDVKPVRAVKALEAAISTSSTGDSTAFFILSPTKSFKVIASTDVIRKQWTTELRKAIDAARGGHPAPLPDMLHPVWVPDTDSSSCMKCGVAFSLIRRRHHCRRCGILLCAPCSRARMIMSIPTARDDPTGKLKETKVRVCEGCAKNRPSVRWSYKKPVLNSPTSPMNAYALVSDPRVVGSGNFSLNPIITATTPSTNHKHSSSSSQGISSPLATTPSSIPNNSNNNNNAGVVGTTTPSSSRSLPHEDLNEHPPFDDSDDDLDADTSTNNLTSSSDVVHNSTTAPTPEFGGGGTASSINTRVSRHGTSGDDSTTNSGNNTNRHRSRSGTGDDSTTGSSSVMSAPHHNNNNNTTRRSLSSNVEDGDSRQHVFASHSSTSLSVGGAGINRIAMLQGARGGGSSRSTISFSSSTASGGVRCKCIIAFQANTLEDPEEISLSIDDVVIVEEVSADWATGVNERTSEYGFFPVANVVVLKDISSVVATTSTTSTTDPTTTLSNDTTTLPILTESLFNTLIGATLTTTTITEDHPSLSIRASGGSSTTVTSPLLSQVERKQSFTDKRTQIMYELVTTERTYIQSLSFLLTLFLRPLVADYRSASRPSIGGNICGAVDETTGDATATVGVFISRLEHIFTLNTKLLADLEELLGQWDTSKTKIGGVFERFAPHLKMYDEFSSAYEFATKTFVVYEKTDSKLRRFLDDQSETFSNVLRGATIYSLLITPIQRVPRYLLLLKELVKNTSPDHVDYKDLTTAIQEMEGVAIHINESIRGREGVVMMRNLDREYPHERLLDVPNRIFIMRGDLNKKSRKKDQMCHFLLFSDMLMYQHTFVSRATAKPPKRIDLSTVKAIDNVTTSDTAFDIKTESKSFRVVAKNQQEKLAWMKSLQETLKNVTPSSNNRRPSGNVGATKVAELVFGNSFREDQVAPVWEQDTPNCQICSKPFTFLTRRHHCRACGRCVDDGCSKGRMLLPHVDETKEVRVCDTCLTDKKESPAKFEEILKRGILLRTGGGASSSHNGLLPLSSSSSFSNSSSFSRRGSKDKLGGNSLGNESPDVVGNSSVTSMPKSLTSPNTKTTKRKQADVVMDGSQSAPPPSSIRLPGLVPGVIEAHKAMLDKRTQMMQQKAVSESSLIGNVSSSSSSPIVAAAAAGSSTSQNNNLQPPASKKPPPPPKRNSLQVSSSLSNQPPSNSSSSSNVVESSTSLAAASSTTTTTNNNNDNSITENNVDEREQKPATVDVDSNDEQQQLESESTNDVPPVPDSINDQQNNSDATDVNEKPTTTQWEENISPTTVDDAIEDEPPVPPVEDGNDTNTVLEPEITPVVVIDNESETTTTPTATSSSTAAATAPTLPPRPKPGPTIPARPVTKSSNNGNGNNITTTAAPPLPPPRPIKSQQQQQQQTHNSSSQQQPEQNQEQDDEDML
jgi:hypothetical protein